MADLSRALFLIGAFVLAGVAQVAWFATPWSRRIAIPLDAGLRWRGRRLLGAHKTLRGFVVMLPASGLAFAGLGVLGARGGWPGLWDLSPLQYGALGVWAGLGFMAGELPNSFLKRQLDIAPGAAASGRLAGALQLLADRLDSGLGMLLSLSLAVPMPWRTWLLVLLLGPGIHWAFSTLMFHLGQKARPA